MNDNIILDIKNLRTEFKTDQGHIVAVNNVSYTLQKGEILGIVGESGSGKTVNTLSIMRLYERDVNVNISGSVLFHGKNLLELSKKK